MTHPQVDTSAAKPQAGLTVSQINDLLQAAISYDPGTSRLYSRAFASDLMSDVLRFHMDEAVLITGLSTVQALRTAEMVNVGCIILARNKRITDDMLELAKENHIAVISSPSTMFEISGKLYQSGIKPVHQ